MKKLIRCSPISSLEFAFFEDLVTSIVDVPTSLNDSDIGFVEIATSCITGHTFDGCNSRRLSQLETLFVMN